MDILFIDIDGVLNTYSKLSANAVWENGKLHVDEDKVKLLSKIVQSADIQLIMHSGWRLFYDDLMNPISRESEELSKMFFRTGIIVSGKTTDFSSEEIKQNRKFSLVKAEEIKAWLLQHPECENYLIIDDLDLRDAVLKQHQIQPDPALGLTEYDAEKAIKHFSKSKV